MSRQDEPVRGFSTSPTGDFLTEAVEQHNRKTRTSLTRLKPRRKGRCHAHPSRGELDTFFSFRLGYSRFASFESGGYVLSRLATGRADVANTIMKNTDTPNGTERHRHITTARTGVVAT